MHKPATALHTPVVVICSQDFEQGYQSGKAFIGEGKEIEVLDSERLISNLKSLSLDGLFDGTKDDLLNWHVGFLVGMIAGNKSLKA